MLMWHRRLWLIDHGAAFYFHHAGGDYVARARDPFPRIADHVLLPFAGALAQVDIALARRLPPATLRDIVGLVPDAWLAGDPAFRSVDERRGAYGDYLCARVEAPRGFVQEAARARSQHL